MYFVDIGQKAKVGHHISVVLRWVIMIGNKADMQVLAGLQLSRLVDIVTDELNVLHHRDVGTLAPNAALHEDKTTVVCYTSNWGVSTSKQMRDDAHTASCGQAQCVV